MRRPCLLVLILLSAGRTGLAWDLPADNATLGRQAIAEILADQEFPETSSYTQRIDFIDFTAHGQPFTQVVITLTPDEPQLRNGKRIVVVGGEPGSEYGMDFISTVEKRDGPAIWLARRGVTFVALTRVGRWTFLALEKAITDRRNAFVLFWGMSTGGASLYPLAKLYPPDGYLGWGTSTTGLAYLNNRARVGNIDDLYEHSALRVRERGLDDFEVYTKHVDAATRAAWWKAALRSPRFKSTEDAAMYLDASALAEQ